MRFSACRYSLAAATRKLGDEPELNPAAEPVDAEYVLVRPQDRNPSDHSSGPPVFRPGAAIVCESGQGMGKRPAEHV